MKWLICLVIAQLLWICGCEQIPMLGGKKPPQAGQQPSTRAESAGTSQVEVTQLKCEYLSDPLGIDVVKPRLSWVIKSDERDQKQTAYRILVADSPGRLASEDGNLWDSGKVQSDKSIQVQYDGKSLASRDRCYWKVRVWDKNGNVSDYSPAAAWEMGLLAEQDWKAKWISAPQKIDPTLEPTASPFFRREFTVDKPIEKARAYICGLGYYELSLNGKKVGDHVLDPAFTRYDRRVLYATYDLTDRLTQGENAAGVILGNGWYNMHTQAVWNFDEAPWRARPTVLCQIEIQFVDGSTKTVTTSPDWKMSTGPILFESIRQGEYYDARLEMPGWNKPGFDDGDWTGAQQVSGPDGVLSAQMMPAMKVIDTFEPVRITEPKDGVYLLDMGQNLTGYAALTVKGPAGRQVVMKYGERLNADGTLDQTDITKYVQEGEFQTDKYILKGEGTEVWHPRFVYHGFRYIEVTGFPGKPTAENIQANVVHTSFDSAGRFQCSNKLFNKIQQATLWSYKSNFHGYPTDCPHREKNGWMGDAHLAAEQAMYNWHNAPAYTKWIRDIKDEQRDSGVIAAIIPTGGWGYHWGNGPAWDSAYFLIPWYMNQYLGDSRILEKNYERYKRYVDFLGTYAKGHIVSIGLGDWVPADTVTPIGVTSTGYYYVDTLMVSRVAAMLGKTAEAEKYADLAENIRKAFNEKFYKGNGVYSNGSQTALSCAIYQGLCPPERIDEVIDRLVEEIHKRNDHIDTGILGAKYLFNTLVDNQQAELANEILNKTTLPSYGYWIKNGATTLWEDWPGREGSLNHIMFGDVSAWFYKNLAGIKIDPERPAFKHVIIAPRLLDGIKWVDAEHESMYGIIVSSWKILGDRFELEVTVPANTVATVYLPTSDAESVTESGQNLDQAPGIGTYEKQNGKVLVSIGSGTYNFACTLNTEQD